MEYLKEFEEIMKPDSRQLNFVCLDTVSGNYRQITLEDFHAKAKSIELNETVPEKVRSHFSAATNLLVYTWFHYPFNVTAQFLAFVTVEMALKERFQVTKFQSFSSLVRRAIKEGLVKDEGFSHVREAADEFPESSGMNENVSPYVNTLAAAMPSLRNELAHGSTMLHMNGAQSVRICAEFINQLFPNPPA